MLEFLFIYLIGVNVTALFMMLLSKALKYKCDMMGAIFASVVFPLYWVYVLVILGKFGIDKIIDIMKGFRRG